MRIQEIGHLAATLENPGRDLKLKLLGDGYGEADLGVGWWF